MKNINRTLIALFLGLLAVGFVFNACKKDDDTSDQIQLFSFGPSPVLRGGELKFIGTNLDQVTAIVLSNNVQVTSFKSKTPELIVLTVPQETVDGTVRTISSGVFDLKEVT